MRSLLTVTSAATLANRRLCTLTAAKSELGITVTTYDTPLTAMIDDASAAIASYCGRVLAEESVQEVWRSVFQCDPLIMARTPVTAIASVTEDGDTVDAADYEVDGLTGLLWRLDDDERTAWTAAKITVAYTAGYRVPDQSNATLPADISRAAVPTVSAWWAARGRDPLLRSDSSESVGSASWIATAEMGALPPQAIALIDGYREIAV